VVEGRVHSYEQLEKAWAQVPAPPRGRGSVAAIGVRKGGGAHASVSTAQLTVEGGVEGDRWAKGDDPKRHSQVTLMSTHVASLIAHVGKAGYESGDNFYVDLDLHEDHLPAGTRLRIGEALLEVTPEPHTGCKKFRARFGLDALRWINAKDNRPHRLRGLHAEVIEGGEVKVGDEIVVLGEG